MVAEKGERSKVMNFIHHIKSLYPQQSCKNLIKWFNKSKNLQRVGRYGTRKFLNNREISIRLLQLEDFYGLGKALKEGIESFNLNYSHINKSVRKWKLDPLMLLVKYQPNKYYTKLHCENDGHPHHLQRVFAWQIFLNSIKSGGGTKFIHQKFISQPIAGDFYMWPAGCTHLHQGIKAPRESKYLVTGWCNYDIEADL